MQLLKVQLQIQLQLQVQASSKMSPLNFITRISFVPHWNLHQTGLDSHWPRFKSRSRSRSGLQIQIQLQMSSKMRPLNFITRISSFPRWNLHQTCLDSHCPRFKSRSRSRSRSRKSLTSLDKLFNTNRVTVFRVLCRNIYSEYCEYDPGRACHLCMAMCTLYLHRDF